MQTEGLQKRYMCLKLSLAIFFVVTACISCAGMFRSDIEKRLISEMEGNCTKVEVKMDYEGEVYVISYTGKVSEDKCPVASIKAWKNGALIEEKEVRICRCRGL